MVKLKYYQINGLKNIFSENFFLNIKQTFINIEPIYITILNLFIIINQPILKTISFALVKYFINNSNIYYKDKLFKVNFLFLIKVQKTEKQVFKKNH